MNTTLTAPLLKSVTLYYREGSSDKVYQASIEPGGQGFLVNFAYGRRGSTLNTGSKPSAPVDYEAASRIFDKLVREKMAKGYTPGQSGTPYQETPREKQATGIKPQLLNPIDEEDMGRCITDPKWCMQEKMDGKRVLIRKEGDKITGINRKGLVIGLPESIVKSTQVLASDCLLDGECVGELFWVFDILSLDEDSILLAPYQERLGRLTALLASSASGKIQLVETAWDITQKLRLLAQLRQAKGEGVVFKRLDAPYTPGRPASGGPQLKHKFYATLSAVVAQINDHRSVRLQLHADSGLVEAGNVTIPPNQPIPPVGTVVEVRFLYAFPESGHLYQPVYLGVREDLSPSECGTSQLKFKSSEQEEEEA